MQEDDEDLKDDQFFDDQLEDQNYIQNPSQGTVGLNPGPHHHTNKHDMNFVLGGQGIEGEPFIDLSPIDITGQCDETYMRLTSMKQERSKVMSGQHSVMFGMKGGDGSDISVWSWTMVKSESAPFFIRIKKCFKWFCIGYLSWVLY